MRFRVDTAQAVRRIRGIAVALPAEVGTAVQRTARDRRDALRSAAPRGETGRLRAGIQVGGSSMEAMVRSTARSDRGYAYTGVSRFGHRRASPDRIYPKRGRALGPIASLGGRFFSSVARYHPAQDWAARPLAGSRFALERESREMLRRL